MKVQYLLEASNELNEAFDYIAGHASLGTAAALLADIEAAEKLLLQFPNAGESDRDRPAPGDAQDLPVPTDLSCAR